MDYKFTEEGKNVYIELYSKEDSLDSYKIEFTKSSIIISKKADLSYKKIIEFYKDLILIECIKRDNSIIYACEKVETSVMWETLKGPLKDLIDKSKKIIVNGVVEDIEEEEEVKSPSKDLYEILKEIYKKGNSDVKRAMDKSFMESGGTVLNTNWSDVENKNYSEKD